MSSIPAALRRTARRVRRSMPRRKGPAILMYHRVADECFDPWGMAVRPVHFAEQIDWLARNRELLPLNEFAAAHREGRLSRNAIAITFDDGYACTFTKAAAVLDRLGVPATVFVPSAALGRGGEYWWDELERLVLGTDAEQVALDGRTIVLGRASKRDRAWRPFDPPRTARQRAFRTLWAMIQQKRSADVEAAMASLREQLGCAELPRDSHRIATTEEVKSSLLDMGCHGLTHASLTPLTGDDRKEEILGAKAQLTELIGTAPRTFAFPFGQLDEDAISLTRKAGFDCACGSRERSVRRDDDPFALPRLMVDDTGSDALERLLGGR